MDLQAYINNHSDYITQFKNAKLVVNRKSPYIIVKYRYNNPPDTMDPEWCWKRYCRGAIIDTRTNRVVCLPPVKAEERTLEDSLSLEQSHDQELSETHISYSPLIDGTMINLFWDTYKNQWMICTRSEMGGYNKWLPDCSGNRKSFGDMFRECVDGSLDDLDEKYSYSLVMRHTTNRNISPIKKNEVWLVDVYHYQDDRIERVSLEDDPSNGLFQCVNHSDQPLPGFHPDSPPPSYASKGFTIKTKYGRYKYINPEYKRVKDLRDLANSNNPYLNFLQLRISGKMKDYLRYFPEHALSFNEYRDDLHKLTNDLYTNYKNLHIDKKIEANAVPYHLKPFVYELHGLYLQSGRSQSITWNKVKDFVYNLPPKRLMYSINFKKKNIDSYYSNDHLYSGCTRIDSRSPRSRKGCEI